MDHIKSPQKLRSVSGSFFDLPSIPLSASPGIGNEHKRYANAAISPPIRGKSKIPSVKCCTFISGTMTSNRYQSGTQSADFVDDGNE